MPSPATLRESCESTASGDLLVRILELLDRAEIPYCLTHGYESYPAHIIGDVDCVMPSHVLPAQLANLLSSRRDGHGATVIQWLQDSAQLVMLHDERANAYLQLHVSGDYRLAHRTLYHASEILETRRRHGLF